MKSPTNPQSFKEDNYFDNNSRKSLEVKNSQQIYQSRSSDPHKRESIKSGFNKYDNQSSDHQHNNKGKRKLKDQKLDFIHESHKFKTSNMVSSNQEIGSSRQLKDNKMGDLMLKQDFINHNSSPSSQSNRSLSACSCSTSNCECQQDDSSVESSEENMQHQERTISNFESRSEQQANSTKPQIETFNRTPTIVFHSPEKEQDNQHTQRPMKQSVQFVDFTDQLEVVDEIDMEQFEQRKKSVTYSHDYKQNLNLLIKQNDQKEIENICFPINIDELKDISSQQNTPKNEVIQIDDQEFSVRNRNKSQGCLNIQGTGNQKLPQYSDSFHQRVVEKSFTNSVQQLLQEVQGTRNKSLTKNEIINQVIAKSKFKADTIPEKALRILLYKKKEQRNNEDIAILQKATIDMNFFQELLSKKSNIQNNVHQSLCKAMQFEFCKQGSIVFYTGDIPDRFYILLKGEVAVMLKKQQEEIDKLKKGTNIDPTDERKKSKFTLRKFLIFKKFQRALKILLIVQDFIRRLMYPEDVLNENESPRKISDYFSFNSSQLQIYDSRNSLDYQNKKRQSGQKFEGRTSLLNQLSFRGNQIIEQPSQEDGIQKHQQRKQSRFFQLQIPIKPGLLSPEYQNNQQSLDTSGLSSASPTLSSKEKKKQRKAKRDKKRRDKQIFSKSQQPVTPQNPQKAVEQMKKTLLPSQLVIFERKQQEQLKQNIDASSKNISGLLKIPKISSVQSPDKKKESNILDGKSSNQSSPKKNSLEPNFQQNVSAVQRKSILDPNTPSASGTPSRRSVRTSFLKKKIKVDFQKVRLGVRLAKIFEPSSQMPQLNLGGAKILQLFQQQNEQFQKILPKLDLMTLENSAHFFDENTFKYFHALNLGEGRVFGDLGILTKKPRAATIVCHEDCYFGVLNVEDYSKILMEQKKKKMQKGIKFLASTINISLSIEKMAKISQFFEKRFFTSGERIYDEGDQVQYIYIIKKGEIELFRKMHTTYGINQVQVINVSIGIIGSKTYFGEDDALFNRKRKFTAIAKIDTNLLMCKKKDFQKLMNEISEMNNELRAMALQKEFWRDQIYEEAQLTRNQIKRIDNLSKTHPKANSTANVPSPQQINDSKQNKNQQLNEQLSHKQDFGQTLNTFQSHRNNTSHSQDYKIKEIFQSEEIVREQLIKLEKNKELVNLAYSRIKDVSTPQHSQNPISQNHHIHNSSNHQNTSIDQSFQHSPKAIHLHSQSSIASPKNKEGVSIFMPDHIQDQSKEQDEDLITSAIAKDDFIGGGLNSQRCYFKGNYQKLSPRLKEIISKNPDLIKEGQIKELLCKIQKKKKILKRNLQGKQQLSAINVFRETRDICMGNSESFKKSEKVADRRKSFNSVDGNNVLLKKEKEDMLCGKKTSQQQFEDLIKSLKEKQSHKTDLSDSMTAELFIQSKQPLVKQNSLSFCRRTNSLDKLFNSDILLKKDSVLQNSSQSISNSQNGILTSSANHTNSQISQSIQFKKAEDNFIFFGQQNAANAIKSKSSFFFTPKHNRIGTFNTHAKNLSFIQKPKSPSNQTQETIKINNTPRKFDHKATLSITQSPGFFKPFTEFVTPLPSPHRSSNKYHNNSQIQTPTSGKNILKLDKIVIVNHMGKPITFTQALHPQK